MRCRRARKKSGDADEDKVLVLEYPTKLFWPMRGILGAATPAVHYYLDYHGLHPLSGVRG